MGRGFDDGAMAVVGEMVHGDEGVVQCLRRCDSSLLVHDEHPAKKVDKLAPINLLGQQLGTLKVRRNINLKRVGKDGINKSPCKFVNFRTRISRL